MSLIENTTIGVNKHRKLIKSKNSLPTKASKMEYKFSDVSIYLTKSLSKDVKKDNGIYFTPPETIHNNLSYLKEYFKDIHTVLEPACGSGEYIHAIHKEYPDIHIVGIENNETIYDNIKEHSAGNIKILNEDYIKYKSDQTYDLIIGNPPYFVMKKGDVDKKYYSYFEGRPNIFILFIIKSLEILSENGILSFVLPKNFLNCIYYNNTRKYINDHYRILKIVECKDKYLDTEQETVILMIQNKKPGKSSNVVNVMNIEGYTIFFIPEEIVKMKGLYENSTSLSNMGFQVNVGGVVWNQVKDKLTDDSTKTRLIYSSDIVNNTLSMKKYKNDEKKNYIDKEGIDEPMLIVNRGYGMGDYKFEYCLIEGGFKYLVENHLICIKKRSSMEMKDSELIESYKKIIHSLNDPRTKQFIEIYFKNNAINTVELNYILPIYL